MGSIKFVYYDIIQYGDFSELFDFLYSLLIKGDACDCISDEMIEKYPIYINNKKVTSICRCDSKDYLSIETGEFTVLGDCGVLACFINLYNNCIEVYEEYGGIGMPYDTYSIYIEDINADEWLKQCFYSGIENMTWQQYIDSEYNIYNFKSGVVELNSTKIIMTDYGNPLCLNGNYVYPTDTIQSFTHYIIE